MELPSTRCFGEPLLAAVTAGDVPEELIDRAAARVLRQKLELGLLDRGWSPLPARPRLGRAGRGPRPGPATRPRSGTSPGGWPRSRWCCSPTARQALPLPKTARVAVIGPLADDPLAFFGCYTMPRHLAAPGVVRRRQRGRRRGRHHARRAPRGARRRRATRAAATSPRADRSGFAEAVATARSADVIVAVVGDQAGLFGHGTSGEGCDVDRPHPPRRAAGAAAGAGRHRHAGGGGARHRPAVRARRGGGPAGRRRPGVLPRRGGRSRDRRGADRAGDAERQAAGRDPPAAGRAALDLPAVARTRRCTRAATVDPTPLFAFGHGLSYTTFGYADLELSADRTATDGGVGISCTVRNTGSVAGTEVVQLYLGDPVASVVRPTRWLAGFTRVALAPGESARVTFRLHADRTAFTGRDGTRIVEPGDDLGRRRGRVRRSAAVRLVHADRPGTAGRGRPGAHHPGLGPDAQHRRDVTGLPLSAERHLSSHLIDHQHLSAQCCRGSRWRTS